MRAGTGKHRLLKEMQTVWHVWNIDALVEETEWEYQEVSSENPIEPASNNLACTQFERLIPHSNAPTSVHECTRIYTHEIMGTEYKPKAIPETTRLNVCFLIKFDFVFHKIKSPLGGNPGLLVLWVSSAPVFAS